NFERQRCLPQTRKEILGAVEQWKFPSVEVRDIRTVRALVLGTRVQSPDGSHNRTKFGLDLRGAKYKVVVFGTDDWTRTGFDYLT
ncbi:hypothetical protein BaRGS_00037995, partial [Batillaria attramentaria]